MPEQLNIDIHVHPFVGNNTLVDVVQAMGKRGLDVVALEALDHSLYPFLVEEARKAYPSASHDRSGIMLPDGKYLLNAREYSTRENLHVLTVGYSMDDATPETEIRKVIDSGLSNGALVVLDHPFIDNGGTKTAGHISEQLEQEVEKLCKEYSGKIAMEWNGYCIPWIRQVLKHVLNIAGFQIKYHDINKKAEELSERLRRDGYNVPVLPDTDLHARRKGHLRWMGRARFTTYIEGETVREAVDSMIRNVFEGRYESVKKYVGSLHLIEAFCLPIIMPTYFKKPRA